ncbi:signal sequence receptor alpha subunit [Fusarium albosuccineum]|uniref:Signal sequence receptor alpha subunit n=1 Tax=Fusarium albosuccineum TaxID=1237068 RepID=A0A8H4PBH5_9HYPO|nr:signal sequence receptor alpha subunit [Fusarium albosuccineum]
MASPYDNKEPASPYQTPFVWSRASNVHVVTSRESFTAGYEPFESYYKRGDGQRVQVLGVGTVELFTDIAGDAGSGELNKDILRLKKVLYAPGAPVNIIGNPLLDDWNVNTEHLSWWKRGIFNRSGDLFASFEKPRSAGVFEVAVFGHEALRFPEEVLYLPYSEKMDIIQAHWPHSERYRFENTNSNLVEQVIDPAQYNEDAEGYEGYDSVISIEEGKASLNSEETAWQRENFKTEFYLLSHLGLSYWREEDREVGRAYVRKMMRRDKRLEERHAPIEDVGE